MAYHDPCYLGRYNEVYDQPRDVLNSVEGGFVELPRCRDRGFCCGAGGARAFMEEKRGTRISHNRLNEAIDTQASGVAVACPFCVTMFEDGVRGLNVEETFRRARYRRDRRRRARRADARLADAERASTFANVLRDGHRRHGQAGPRPGHSADPLQVDEAAKKVIPPAGVCAGHERLRRARAGSRAAARRSSWAARSPSSAWAPTRRATRLKRAIAMGADAAVHINDPALNDADSTTTARALAAAIKKLDHVDLVLSRPPGLGHRRRPGPPGRGQPCSACRPSRRCRRSTRPSAESLVVERIIEDGYQRLKVTPARAARRLERDQRAALPAAEGHHGRRPSPDPGLDGQRPGPGRARRAAASSCAGCTSRRAKRSVELIEADSLGEAGTRLADKLREARLV